jgi:hypothetical protein
MKRVLLMLSVFIGSTCLISAQDFKKFIPEKEPFKVFKLPEFPQIVIPENKNDETFDKEIKFSELDNMPIMKLGIPSEQMPIYKPSNKVKYSLLAIDPLKKEDIFVPEK